MKPTPWQVGFACSVDCFEVARESLSPEEWGFYVAASLELFRRESVRLLHAEALRALHEEDGRE